MAVDNGGGTAATAAVLPVFVRVLIRTCQRETWCALLMCARVRVCALSVGVSLCVFAPSKGRRNAAAEVRLPVCRRDKRYVGVHVFCVCVLACPLAAHLCVRALCISVHRCPNLCQPLSHKGLAHVGQMRRAACVSFAFTSACRGFSPNMCQRPCPLVGACVRVLGRGCFPLPRTLTVRVLARPRMSCSPLQCMPRLQGTLARENRAEKCWTGSVGLRPGPRRYISKKAGLPRSLRQRPLRFEAGARRVVLLYSVRLDRE